MDVDGMLGGMTPRQFDEWALDYQKEPWDITLKQFSQAVALIVNALRIGPVSELKDSDLLPLDFMVPKPEDESPPEKPASSLAAMRALIGV